MPNTAHIFRENISHFLHRHITRHLHHETEVYTEDTDDVPGRAKCSLRAFRHDLVSTIESRWIQYFVAVLLIFDILLTIVELLILANTFGGIYCSEEGEIEHEEWIHAVEDAFFLISLGILGCFLIELGLLIIGMGWRFFTHPFYVIDVIVVVTSFVLEIVLRKEEVALLLILRLWRVLRVFHAIGEEVHESKKRTKSRLESKSDAHLVEMQTEIDELRRQLAQYKAA